MVQIMYNILNTYREGVKKGMDKYIPPFYSFIF